MKLSSNLSTLLLVGVFFIMALPLSAGGSAEAHNSIDDGEAQQAETVSQNGKMLAYVSILPQKFFVQQIAEQTTEVGVMVPPGKSPATYEPSPKQVSKLGQADLFFTIGVPFEKAFIPVIEDELTHLRIIDTSRGIEKRSIHADEAIDIEHNGHSHENEQKDPHIWLSPPLVKKQTAHIRDAFIDINPDNQQLYKENYKAFAKNLDELDKELQQILQPVKGSTILVYHPSFGYFAETYGLTQLAIEMGGKEPSTRQLQKVIQIAKQKNARVIFVQPEFSKASAQKVARAINGAVVEVAPLKPQYMDNMRSIAHAIREGLAENK